MPDRDRAPPVLAIGDSWQYVGLTRSLATELAGFGYRVYTDASDTLCENGKTLRTLASHDLMELSTYVANVDGAPDSPRAVLLSGGGNDLVQRNTRDCRATRLFSLLNYGANSAAAALNDERVREFIDGELMSYVRTLLGAITAATSVPILVHGYDYPVPDGRKLDIPFGPGPWLKPVFDAAGIAPDLYVRREIMHALIERLNAMLENVAAQFAGQVRHVRLAGVLARQRDYTSDHRLYWSNELHATQGGFQILAGKVHLELTALGVAP